MQNHDFNISLLSNLYKYLSINECYYLYER